MHSKVCSSIWTDIAHAILHSIQLRNPKNKYHNVNSLYNTRFYNSSMNDTINGAYFSIFFSLFIQFFFFCGFHFTVLVLDGSCSVNRIFFSFMWYTKYLALTEKNVVMPFEQKNQNFIRFLEWNGHAIRNIFIEKL